MKRTFLLWKLELKKTIRQMPVMLVEAFLLLVLIGMIAFGAAKLFYQDAPAVRITIAVIEKEENPLTDLLLYYVQGMESISALCQFLIVPEEEGFAMLQEGKAAAALVLPEGMVEGIMDGSNAPVQVIFPEDAGMESALLRELTDAGVQMLRVAQAEIYGIYDTAKVYGALEQLAVLEADIDAYNLAFALDRLALFREQRVSAVGNLSVWQYGIASGAVFFLLLLGMACYPVMRPDAVVLQRLLVREGIGAGGQCLGKWLCGLCSMGVSGLFFQLAAEGVLTAAGHGDWMPEIGAAQAGVCLLILLCASAFIFLVFQLAGNGTAAVLLLFFLAVMMQYLAGGFLPSVFLPEAVQRAGSFLPAAYMIDAAGSLYSGVIGGRTLGLLCLFTVLFMGAACLAARLRMAGEV
ncbi:MAG: ABC transporter permease [Blautia sp.]|nr:ABC transporter permease [Blautia sp.]MCM1199998.1 ABC transporter permease [Bacteroides fragilis]